MTKKPAKNKPDKLSNENGYVTAKELMEALDSLKASILIEQKQQSLSSSVEDAPRPRIFHKKKEGRREKLTTTVDSALFELIKQKQQQGQQLSHVLDSALWNYFGRPKLSFQQGSDKE